MDAHSGFSSSVPSLPPPCPKSPPEYPDLYGKRRDTAKVQVLEIEIGFLEEELKTVEGLHPASRYCKEVADFVLAKSDPLIPINRKNQRSCPFWKWLCRMPCFNYSWISWVCCCCYSKCSIHVELPRCCDLVTVVTAIYVTVMHVPTVAVQYQSVGVGVALVLVHVNVHVYDHATAESAHIVVIVAFFGFHRAQIALVARWKCARLKCLKVHLCCGCSKTCCACNPCCLFF